MGAAPAKAPMQQHGLVGVATAVSLGTATLMAWKYRDEHRSRSREGSEEGADELSSDTQDCDSGAEEEQLPSAEEERKLWEEEDPAELVVKAVPILLRMAGVLPSAKPLREPLEQVKGKMVDEVWRVARYQPMYELGELLWELTVGGERSLGLVFRDSFDAQELEGKLCRLNSTSWDDVDGFCLDDASSSRHL